MCQKKRNIVLLVKECIRCLEISGKEQASCPFSVRPFVFSSAFLLSNLENRKDTIQYPSPSSYKWKQLITKWKLKPSVKGTAKSVLCIVSIPQRDAWELLYVCISKGIFFWSTIPRTAPKDSKGTESLAWKTEISTSSKFLFCRQIKSRFIGSLVEVVLT